MGDIADDFDENRESELLKTSCPGRCGQMVEIRKRWTAGGVSDYGGYVLRCTTCDCKFAVYVGRDVSDSQLVSGATLVDTYFDDSKDKDAVLAKHGVVLDA